VPLARWGPGQIAPVAPLPPIGSPGWGRGQLCLGPEEGGGYFTTNKRLKYSNRTVMLIQQSERYSAGINLTNC